MRRESGGEGAEERADSRGTSFFILAFRPAFLSWICPISAFGACFVLRKWDSVVFEAVEDGDKGVCNTPTHPRDQRSLSLGSACPP